VLCLVTWMYQKRGMKCRDFLLDMTLRGFFFEIPFCDGISNSTRNCRGRSKTETSGNECWPETESRHNEELPGLRLQIPDEAVIDFIMSTSTPSPFSVAVNVTDSTGKLDSKSE
jgi:hypothetical protein